MATFDEIMSDAGIKWSMEVLDKTTATLIDIGEVPSYHVRYTFEDTLGNRQTFEAYTWCPEATAIGFLHTSTPISRERVSYDEARVLSELDGLFEGELYEYKEFTATDPLVIVVQPTEPVKNPGVIEKVVAAVVEFFTP